MSKAVLLQYSLAFCMYRLLAVGLVVGVVGGQAALAQTSEFFAPAFQDSAQQSYQLSLLRAATVELAPLSVFELAPSRAEKLTASYQGNASNHAGALVVNFVLNTPDLPAYVRREIPALWRLVIPADFRRQELPLEFQWEKVPGAESQRGAGPLTEPVISPWIHREERDEQGRMVIEGGVYLDIPVASLQNQRYSGRILILGKEF